MRRCPAPDASRSGRCKRRRRPATPAWYCMQIPRTNSGGKLYPITRRFFSFVFLPFGPYTVGNRSLASRPLFLHSVSALACSPVVRRAGGAGRGRVTAPSARAPPHSQPTNRIFSGMTQHATSRNAATRHPFGPAAAPADEMQHAEGVGEKERAAAFAAFSDEVRELLNERKEQIIAVSRRSRNLSHSFAPPTVLCFSRSFCAHARGRFDGGVVSAGTVALSWP